MLFRSQKQVKMLEAGRNQKRRSLFEAQDKVDDRREKLIAEVEAKLAQETVVENLFSIRWRYVAEHSDFDARVHKDRKSLIETNHA